MIAMALACQPKLIIADEPTTALDVTVQSQILSLLKELTRETGAALILITHDLGVVAELRRPRGVMYARPGRGNRHGARVYKAPRHPYTMGLMACVPRLDQVLGRRLVPIDGQPPTSPACRPAAPSHRAASSPPNSAGASGRRWRMSAAAT